MVLLLFRHKALKLRIRFPLLFPMTHAFSHLFNLSAGMPTSLGIFGSDCRIIELLDLPRTPISGSDEDNGTSADAFA
jgi:hypothetical protein